MICTSCRNEFPDCPQKTSRPMCSKCREKMEKAMRRKPNSNVVLATKRLRKNPDWYARIVTPKE